MITIIASCTGLDFYNIFLIFKLLRTLIAENELKLNYLFGENLAG